MLWTVLVRRASGCISGVYTDTKSKSWFKGQTEPVMARNNSMTRAYERIYIAIVRFKNWPNIIKAILTVWNQHFVTRIAERLWDE